MHIRLCSPTFLHLFAVSVDGDHGMHLWIPTSVFGTSKYFEGFQTLVCWHYRITRLGNICVSLVSVAPINSNVFGNRSITFSLEQIQFVCLVYRCFVEPLTFVYSCNVLFEFVMMCLLNKLKNWLNRL